MILRFRVEDTTRFNAIRFLKRRDGIEQLASDEDYSPGVRSFHDPYWREGDEYRVLLLLNDEVVFEHDWQEITLEPCRTIRLRDLFHPAQAASAVPGELTWISVVHQTLDPNSWWNTSRSWLVRIQDGCVTLTDEMFLPAHQPSFNYRDLDIGNLFIMPQQLFHWLEYLSFQVEKPFYNYPETVPKAYSINEMLMALDGAVKFYNGQQPQTKFCFNYGAVYGVATFPAEPMTLIVELAAIELIKANVINWLELEFGYSDGVDVEITKYDKYSSYLDSLKGDLIERIDRDKTRYVGRGVFNGSKFGFSGPFNTGGPGGQHFGEIPILKVLRDTPGARGGVFNRTNPVSATNQ